MRSWIAKRCSTILFLLLSTFVAGCASSGRLTDCPEPVTATPEYIIGAGDSLSVFVWRNPEVSATVQVRPDGRISTPLVDDMLAAGKTPVQLARDMEQELSEFLRSPNVNIMIATPGEGMQVQVLGEVVSPQSVTYRDSMRLLDVLLNVGGLGEFAAGNRAVLARTIDSRPVECAVKLQRLMDGDLSQNIRVFPGDVIVVPATRF